MSWVKRLGGRLPDFADVVRRFPIAVLIMGVFTLWIIVQQLGDSIYGEDEAHIFGGFILCGYIAIIMGLISEARGWNRPKGLMLGISIGLPTFLVCYLAKHLDFNVPMAIAAAIVFLGNAAAFRTIRHDSNVWNFTQKLWTGAIFAAVGSVIFALGMGAISEAVRSLFGFRIDNLTYDILLPIGLAFLAPIYWMGTLPRYGDVEDVSELSFEARALSFLGTWMLAPLVIIYSLIILAYGAKILIQWELPKGEIAILVTPFLGVGMLVWLMLEPKVLKESGFVKFYRHIWHWVMLAATILLAIAVFVRIREYGFTVERFLLTIIVIWGFAQSLWFVSRSQVKRDIRIPTGIAAVLLLFGAFTAEPISSINQFKRASAAKAKLSNFDRDVVKTNLTEARIFLGGMNYFIKNNDKKRFKRLLPDQDMPTNTYGPEYTKLTERLGLVGIEKNPRILYVTYVIESENPWEIPDAGKLYGSYRISMFNEDQLKGHSEVFSNRDKLVADFSIGDEIYPVDFEAILQQMKIDKKLDFDTMVSFPAVDITSRTGQKAVLLIVGGNISQHGRSERNGTFEVVVFVPN